MKAAIDYLGRFAVTHGMNEPELHLFHKYLEDRAFKRGDRICTEGEETEGMFLISLGTLSVTRETSKNQSVELVRLPAPTVVGEISLITGWKATANVVADTEAHAALLSHEAFGALGQTATTIVAKLNRNIAHVLATRLDATSSELARLASAQQREEMAEITQKIQMTW
jgi:CRP-like cAMP-binding protein